MLRGPAEGRGGRTMGPPTPPNRLPQLAHHGPATDRYLSPEIEHSVQLVKGGDYVEAVEAVVGQLR